MTARRRLLLPVPGVPHVGAPAAGLVRLPGRPGRAARRRSRPRTSGTTCARYGCTVTALIPAMMNWLLDQPPRPDDLDNPLRWVAGAPVVPRVDEFKARFGIAMRTQYGNTEIGTPLYAGPDVSADRASTAKWVTPGYEVRVVDEHDYEVPAGEIGELRRAHDRAVADDGRLLRDAGEDRRGVAQRLVPHRRRRGPRRERPLPLRRPDQGLDAPSRGEHLLDGGRGLRQRASRRSRRRPRSPCPRPRARTR